MPLTTEDLDSVAGRVGSSVGTPNLPVNRRTIYVMAASGLTQSLLNVKRSAGQKSTISEVPKQNAPRPRISGVSAGAGACVFTDVG